MNRVDCTLEKLGHKISKQHNYKSVKSLPLSLYGIITSGFYGNIYAASSNKNGPRKVNYLLPDKAKTNMLHTPEKHFIVKLMHDSKYNRRDINRLRMVQPLLRANICPHFPVVYGVFRIDNVKFRGIRGNGVTKLQDIKESVREGPAVGYIMENLGHMTLENYVFWKPRAAELKQILFQCFVGIYALVKYARMNHSDFHFKNVMIINIKKPQTYVYFIDNVKYTVLAKQYVPVIIDINGNRTGQTVNQMKDVVKLSKQIRKLMPKLWEDVNIDLNFTSLRSFFAGNFDQFKSPTASNSQVTNNIRAETQYKFNFF